MKLSGSHRLPYPRAVVWDALMDPEVLSRTLPGCERLEATGDGAFSGSLIVQVGPVRGQFDGTLEMTDRRSPESYRMKLAGQGASGFLTGEGAIRLEEAEGGAATLLHYDLDAQVGGRIAGVGQRLLDSSAKVIARQGLEGLERQLATRAVAAGAPGADDGIVASGGLAREEGPAPPAPAPPAAPSQREFVSRFARGLWDEVVPPAARPWLIAAAVALLALVVLLVMMLGD
ncbi:MAG TPA: carbon monoxide dehydrogenase subunit G [Thermoanaerobaculia bacterium]|nr:carbon monoxide dehydrogenase subunit G [Thermoanaerobaculia bacterium]